MVPAKYGPGSDSGKGVVAMVAVASGNVIEREGGGENVGDGVGMASVAPQLAENTITNSMPNNFCGNFGLFILCSFLYY